MFASGHGSGRMRWARWEMAAFYGPLATLIEDVSTDFCDPFCSSSALDDTAHRAANRLPTDASGTIISGNRSERICGVRNYGVLHCPTRQSRSMNSEGEAGPKGASATAMGSSIFMPFSPRRWSDRRHSVRCRQAEQPIRVQSCPQFGLIFPSIWARCRQNATMAP
jgi:hypothetical protein